VLQRIIVDIVNVVSTSTISGPINLSSLTENISALTYRPSQFPGAILRIKDPHATILIFGSGKIVCTGTRSVSQAAKATDKILNMLRNVGCVVDEVQTKIENIVASVNLGRRIDLDECARVLPRSMYEPEQFPAVFHRMRHPPATILLYNTGRIICTGLDSIEKTAEATACLFRTLEGKNCFSN
jgi:transcription initiation factor TFIID TATA-box-binding protein